MEKEHILLGTFSCEALDLILSKASAISDIGRRIDFLSGNFFGLGYEEGTLIGNDHSPEVFVINFQGVDCFTFIEYIEAMRLSKFFREFQVNLKRVRYKSGIIDYTYRNHFFTDWIEHNSAFINNITGETGARKTQQIRKVLNVKEDGTLLLPGIQAVTRDIDYIPSERIDDAMYHAMKTGDYVGIYSELPGLDVSHVGIVIRDKEMVFLRHASSQQEYRKVIDQDLRQYIMHKPGILLLRPKEHTR
jgi:hypothetical protein